MMADWSWSFSAYGMKECKSSGTGRAHRRRLYVPSQHLSPGSQGLSPPCSDFCLELALRALNDFMSDLALWFAVHCGGHRCKSRGQLIGPVY